MLPMASETRGPAPVSLVFRMRLYMPALPSIIRGTKTALLRVSCQEARNARPRPVSTVIANVITAASASPVKALMRGASDARRLAKCPLVRASNQATSCRSMALKVRSRICLVSDSPALRKRPSCRKVRRPIATAMVANLRHSALVLCRRSSGTMFPTYFPWRGSYRAGGWLKRLPTSAKRKPMKGRNAATGPVKSSARARTNQSGFCSAHSRAVGTLMSTSSSGGASCCPASAGPSWLTARSRPPMAAPSGLLVWRAKAPVPERVEFILAGGSPEPERAEAPEFSRSSTTCTGSSSPPATCCSSTSWAYNDPSSCMSSSCVPRWRMTPFSMTKIWSASLMVLSRCATTSVVRAFWAIRSSSAFCTIRSLCVSRALVASSSRSTAGSRTMDLAMAMRCFCPPLSCAPRSPTSVE
mmetsp:Transcript_110418/g.344212  ORF Transcript_110418/g.344212 Transcript_110418/m.344212 type:complete len:414 (+) Transcript_110418:1444-2685(+)